MNSTVYRWSNCYLKETDHLSSGAGTYLDRVGGSTWKEEAPVNPTLGRSRRMLMMPRVSSGYYDAMLRCLANVGSVWDLVLQSGSRVPDRMPRSSGADLNPGMG